LINLNERNCPREFPKDTIINDSVFFPLFLKDPYFNVEIDWSYFFAITSEKLTSLTSIWVDLANLWIITIYFLTYRNPVFGRKIKKILWFPTENPLI
jgi:hypothetical protein